MGYIEDYCCHGHNFDAWNPTSIADFIQDFGNKKFLVKGKERTLKEMLPLEVAKLVTHYPHSEEEIKFFNFYKLYDQALQVHQARSTAAEPQKHPVEPQAL